jgi:predicted  nucleic acid-binding Zn-ribbon protein
MTQEAIDLMKNIVKMDSAIPNDEKEIESMKEKLEAKEQELNDLRQQHKDSINKLTSILNQL